MTATPADHPGARQETPQASLRGAQHGQGCVKDGPEARRHGRARVHPWQALDYIAEHSAWTEREHLMWLGPRNRRGGVPVVPLADGSVMPVRRYLNGHRKRDGFYLIIDRACPARQCVNPDHASYRYIERSPAQTVAT